MPWLDTRSKIAVSFLTSMVVGVVTARRADSGDRVKRTVLANAASTAGLLVGYQLVERSRESDIEAESGEPPRV